MAITAMNRKVRRPPPRAASPLRDDVPASLKMLVQCAAKWWMSLVEPRNISTRLKDPLAGAKTKEEKALAKAVLAIYHEVTYDPGGERHAK